jgi:hypothetical protein
MKITLFMIPMLKTFLYNKYSKHSILGYSISKKIVNENYRNNMIYYDDKNFINKNSTINCEHVCSQVFFEHKEPMKSDLHILFSSNAKINSHRQAYKFDIIKDNYDTLDNEGNKIPINHAKSARFCKKNSKKKVFEPPNLDKRIIARSCSYFYLVYPNYSHKLHQMINKEQLLEWNSRYLVNFRQIFWNEIIYHYQKNINPFVRYPILVEIMLSDKLNIGRILRLSINTFYGMIASLYAKMIIKSIL